MSAEYHARIAVRSIALFPQHAQVTAFAGGFICEVRNVDLPTLLQAAKVVTEL